MLCCCCSPEGRRSPNVTHALVLVLALVVEAADLQLIQDTAFAAHGLATAMVCLPFQSPRLRVAVADAAARSAMVLGDDLKVNVHTWKGHRLSRQTGLSNFTLGGFRADLVELGQSA